MSPTHLSNLAHTPRRYEMSRRKYERIMSADVAQHFIYSVFDADDALLYIGRSVDVAKRFRAHQLSSPWGSEAARWDATGPYTYPQALSEERAAIEAGQPRHNRMFTRAHGWDAASP